MDRSSEQLVRHLFYHGRICAIQLNYSDAKDLLSQAVRKVRLNIYVCEAWMRVLCNNASSAQHGLQAVMPCAPLHLGHCSVR